MSNDIKGPGGLNMGPQVYKKKFRWVMQGFLGDEETFTPQFVKVHPRPEPETELDFLNVKMWIPGRIKPGNKAHWPKINICCEQTVDWTMPSVDRIVLSLYDGCGNKLEEWNLLNVECIAVQKSDCYPGDPYLDVDLTFRYETVKYKYTGMPFPAPVIKNQVTIE